MSERAILLADQAFRTPPAKTSHGLVRGPSRFPLAAVVDASCAGQDAGDVARRSRARSAGRRLGLERAVASWGFDPPRHHRRRDPRRRASTAVESERARRCRSRAAVDQRIASVARCGRGRRAGAGALGGRAAGVSPPAPDPRAAPLVGQDPASRHAAHRGARDRLLHRQADDREPPARSARRAWPARRDDLHRPDRLPAGPSARLLLRRHAERLRQR